MVCCCLLLLLAAPNNTHAQAGITRIEYYIDTDPGYGKATPLSFAPDTAIHNLPIQVNPASLGSGIHSLFVRAMDATGKWSFNNRWLFVKPYGNINNAPPAMITHVEWYIDDDPGYSKGHQVPLLPGDMPEDVLINVNPAGLTAGIHSFYVRAKDANGNWSMANRWLFVKPYTESGETPPANITYAEWYVDNDPGPNQANSLGLTPGTTISNLLVNINPANLTAGIHAFFVRARDAQGNWSLTNRWLFIKPYNETGNAPAPNITQVEWYVDRDPGLGNATNLSVTPGADLNNVLINVDPGTLTGGIHSFYVRAKDVNGQWSLVNRWLFVKPYNESAGVPPSNISYLEWYVDQDPGLNQATAVALTPGIDLKNLVVNVDPTSISTGIHSFYIRGRNAVGNWSMVNRWLFVRGVDTSVTGNTKPDLTYLEYYINKDPGLGKATSVAVTPGADIHNLAILVRVDTLQPGQYTLFIRAKDAKGSWSLVNKAAFQVDPPDAITLTLGALPDSVCASSTVPMSFTASALYGASNVFTLQGSDQNGSFSNPTTLGTLTSNSSGTIQAVIPANAVTGFNYRVRLLTTAPADTVTSDKAITLLRLPDHAPGITGKSQACIGKEIYTPTNIEPGVQYKWSILPAADMDTTGGVATINWTIPARYQLYVQSYNKCGDGPGSLMTITVGMPPNIAPVITANGRTLNATVPSTNYQWYRNDTAIAGETGPTYYAANAGSYTLKFTNGCGSGPASNAIVFADQQLTQTINFPVLTNKLFGDPPFALQATASSGLPVSYAIVSGPAILIQNMVQLTGAGTVVISASQPGDANYLAATPVIHEFTVSKTFQSITFNEVPDQPYGQNYLTLSANSTSGLPVQFSVVTGYARITGNNYLQPLGAGTVVVRASQPGNGNYQSAAVDRSFCIAAPQPSPIQGFKEACAGTTNYAITPVQGVTYSWTLSGGGNLLATTGASVPVNWTTLGTYTLTVKAITNCGADTTPVRTAEITVTNTLTPTAPTNLFPANGTVINAFPISCSWQPGVNALVYDLYVWADSTTEPINPTISNIDQIGTVIWQQYLPVFAAGKKHHWKVVGKNACAQASSPTQHFIISELPNLIVANGDAPDEAFTGTAIDVTFEIKNNGKESTRATTWYDAIYLSADTILNKVIDPYLGARANVSALQPGQSYNSVIRGNLPRNIIGQQYILVETNYDQRLGEAAGTDNVKVIPLVINLTPPPDLRVTNVVTTGDAFSGEPITLQWTVINKGTGNNKELSWYDVVYLSPDSTLDKAAAVQVAAQSHSGILKPDSSYTQNITLTLPDRLFGKHYLYVVTDAGNQVFEFTAESNNTGRSDALNIFLTPPPDLVVTGLNNPEKASTGELVLVDWTVQNQGATAPRAKDRRWRDAIYLSKDSVFSRNSATLLATVAPTPYPGFNNGETYSNEERIAIPRGFKDTCYWFVVTDYSDDVFEYTNESNNMRRSKILIQTPDLIVNNVVAPATGSSGNDVMIEWTVKNQGNGKIPSQQRTDIIWLSPTPSFNAATALRAGQLAYGNPLDPGASAQKQQTLKLPQGIQGTYYVFIDTDYSNAIFEGDAEGNNRDSSGAVAITLSPWADLQVTSVTLSADTLHSEQKIGIRYTVANKGAAPISGASWRDQVYISKDSALNSKAFTLQSFTQTQYLGPNESYEIVDSLYISMNLLRNIGVNMANCYFYVRTDVTNSIYEYQADTNNVLRSKAIHGMHAEHADLAITQVSLPDSVIAGQPAKVAWSVINKGGMTGYYYDYWYDGIFVSKDTIFDAGDAFITDAVLYSPLHPNETYSDKLSFTVPNGLSGNYYLLMVADHKNYNRDKNLKDNYKTITYTENGQPTPTPKPINIFLPPSADLTVTSFQHPTTGDAGQPIHISWTILNQGPGATTKGGWTERVYLSADNKVDGGDKVLASYARKGDLASNGTYQDSLDITLPRDAAGNYYILFQTDNNNGVYEHEAENNNTASGTIFILQPAPSDLIVSDVTALPATVSIGGPITIQWTLSNLGANAATGKLKEGIYLSKDTVWNKEDLLLYTSDAHIQLPPQGSEQHSQQIKVTGLSAGQYYALVRTDLADNIFEDNEGNNTQASIQTVSLDVPELKLNIPATNQLAQNESLYYRLEIPDSLAGETLLVSLKSDSLQGANELYIKYGDVPTRTTYDLVYSNAFKPNQEIVIPATVKGSYYILVYGAVNSGQPQPITLLAKKINFEILTIAAKEGGNTGSVTVKISGAKFEQGMQILLQDATLGSTPAHTITYVNSTTLFASFNLAGMPVGLYDVKMKKANKDSTSLPDGFSIVNGPGGGLAGGGGTGGGFYCTIKNVGVNQLMDVDVQYPEATRTRRVFPMVINFGNSANVDIPVPTRILISVGGDPISFVTDGMVADMINGKTELYIEFKELNAPVDVLRPGATGSITIFTLSQTGSNLRFRLIR
jgi:subtilase family serine protease